ncbi:hypothetical protein AK812_SmicGene22608 [Symbiodinium microadriaticum]|uniref:Uncharacterized protein n=1 Tax=Symbiodinium microadriaticum TaxID=2951 RepID=A0A1Q9DJB2_SYMMI|nr:hypothetical protein AK812_SmicGene22608 [Symbiodinium microadriaticum]
MLLSALPKGVKGDLIVYWVQGVHQILYRLMAIFQPGGVQDRAQILRQMDVSESGAADSEVVPPLAESIVPRSDVAGRVAAGEVSLDGCAEDLGAEPAKVFCDGLKEWNGDLDVYGYYASLTAQNQPPPEAAAPADRLALIPQQLDKAEFLKIGPSNGKLIRGTAGR